MIGLLLLWKGGAPQAGLPSKDHTGRETVPRGIGFGVGLSRQSGLKVPGGPHTSSHPNYTWGTTGINSCGGPIRQFPFRYWGNLLRAYWSPWPTFFPIHFRNGTVWTSQKMGQIIYVSLLLLTPKILSLLFDPQDNAFLSWVHSYAAFHNQSNCWVCGALPSSSVKAFPWWTSPLQGKDFLQICKHLQQQSHMMPLLKLMTSNSPKMDWCNYGHNVTFHFDFYLV